MKRAAPELHARLREWARVYQAASEAFEHTRDRAHVVRRDAVVAHVAERMGVPVSPALRRKVTFVVSARGWLPLSNGGRAFFSGVKHREHTPEQAAEMGQRLRRK